MSGLKVSLVLVIFLVLASQFLVLETLAEASKDVAASALKDAEDVVASAYRAVSKAEEAGANVSDLLVRLNEAGGFLANAHMAYRSGDLEKAASLANSSRNIGVEVDNAAVELKGSAFLERVQRIWFMIISSVFGVTFVFLGSFWVWRVFRRRYYRQVLVKSEVSSDES